jgi:hypothetical protein
MTEAPNNTRAVARLRRCYESPRLIKRDKLARLTGTGSVSAVKPTR